MILLTRISDFGSRISDLWSSCLAFAGRSPARATRHDRRSPALLDTFGRALGGVRRPAPNSDLRLGISTSILFPLFLRFFPHPLLLFLLGPLVHRAAGA